MSLETTVGATIRKIRLSKNLYSMTVADRVPMSRSYLSEVENGYHIPSVALLQDIARALDLKTSELMYAITDSLVEQGK